MESVEIKRFTVYTREGMFTQIFAKDATEAERIIINRTLGRAHDVHAVRE